MTRGRITLITLFGVAVAAVWLAVSRSSEVPPTGPSPGGRDDGSEAATLRYWQEAGRTFRRAGGVSLLIAKHAADFQPEKLTNYEQFAQFWGEWGRLYDWSAADAREAVVRLRHLPTEGVDPIATEAVAAAAGYLECRAELNTGHAGDCREYAALYGDLITATTAAGAAAGAPVTAAEDAVPGRLIEREERLRAAMTRRVETDGRAEKERLAATLAAAEKARSELSARFGVEFLDFNTPPRPAE